ncbi:hypothetical protein ACJIZ3_020605 [Penstemon smallii]|uniref:Uncharacterized protein n=1 Tax=Penstemon smallii TaxID=265156 RepID=A0ABD3SJH8_9LAMI
MIPRLKTTTKTFQLNQGQVFVLLVTMLLTAASSLQSSLVFVYLFFSISNNTTEF